MNECDCAVCQLKRVIELAADDKIAPWVLMETFVGEMNLQYAEYAEFGAEELMAPPRPSEGEAVH